MPPWLSQISSALKKESKFNSTRWVQLATIGIDNTPRVRTVVFRGWSKSYEMEIYSDKRTQKFHELDLNNNVEICWLFSESKCQFRFRGTSSINLGKVNRPHWDQLSGKSKLMWSWSYPGDYYVPRQTERLSEKAIEVDLLNNFVLLKINITQVDQLILNKTIHKRIRWVLKDDWIEERINP